MKTITATQLKTNTGDFFDALISEGEVTVTRNGKEFPLKMVRDEGEKMGLRETSKRIVEVIEKVAASIPEDKREFVAEQMETALAEHRAEVRKKRQEALDEKNQTLAVNES